jgi:hypothetical protein
MRQQAGQFSTNYLESRYLQEGGENWPPPAAAYA